MAPPPLAGDEAVIRWWPPNLEREDCILFGHIFLDGSALFPEVQGLTRSGWACVQTDDRGNTIRIAYGPVPAEMSLMQDSRAAEDYAALMASRLVDPSRSFSLYSDCQGAVQCLSSGTQCAPNAHMWGLIWTTWSPHDHTVHNVPAH